MGDAWLQLLRGAGQGGPLRQGQEPCHAQAKQESNVLIYVYYLGTNLPGIEPLAGKAYSIQLWLLDIIFTE